MMKKISKRLNLSRIYTNHCIRATCVTMLSAHGLEARHIMRVTGHKSESSLRSYDNDNSEKQKRLISSILTKALTSASSMSEREGSTSAYSNQTVSLAPSTQAHINYEIMSDEALPSESDEIVVLGTENKSQSVSSTVKNETVNLNVSPNRKIVIANNHNCSFNFNLK